MVILVSFLVVPAWERGGNESLQVVELFAGVARVAKLSAWMGLRSRAFDISYSPLKHPMKLKRGKLRRSSMDLNGSAGLAFLASQQVCDLFERFVCFK